jgi:hypothetical protein
LKIEQKILTNPILATVSTCNPSIEGSETYFDIAVAVNFVHCELGNVLERQLDKMSKCNIKVTTVKPLSIVFQGDGKQKRYILENDSTGKP